MTVFHGGQVRFKDEKGALTDYDPGLVEIEAGETTEAKASLDGYKYRNKTGDEKQYLPKKLSEEKMCIRDSYRGCTLQSIAANFSFFTKFSSIRRI